MSDLREYIWKRQYALYKDETYQDGLYRVARHVADAEERYGENPAEWTERFYRLMNEGQFMPGGRILAGAGSEHGNLLNCLHGDTLVQTKDGVFPIRELAGTQRWVLTRDGNWRLASFRWFGRQNLYRVVFANGQVVLATPNHRWYVDSDTGVLEEVTTRDLQDRYVPLIDPQLPHAGAVRVTAVEDLNLSDDVYCAIEPETHSFVLAGGLLTGNCFVVDGAPEKPGSTAWVLHLAQKLALITKVGGGTGLNLDPIAPKQPYTGPAGRLYLHIDNHPDADDVYAGRITDRYTGEKVERGYRKARGWAGPGNALTLTVPDSIEGIWAAAGEMVQHLLSGKDVTLDLSALRPEGALVKGSGGTSSGPASFAVEVFDNFAYWASLGGAEYAGPVATLRYIFAPTLRVIRQGGTRRGAGMATLSIDHPDWEDFLTAKDLEREEAEGDISTYNISFLVPDGFMQSSQTRSKDALWRIAAHAHATGEPGLIFVDTVNRHNPLAEVDGSIVATNPLSL